MKLYTCEICGKDTPNELKELMCIGCFENSKENPMATKTKHTVKPFWHEGKMYYPCSSEAEFNKINYSINLCRKDIFGSTLEDRLRCCCNKCVPSLNIRDYVTNSLKAIQGLTDDKGILAICRLSLNKLEEN